MSDQPIKIFIVEDEVLVAFEMSDTLEDLGFEVVGPSLRLDDAETRAMNSEIDVAMLDVNMGAGLTTKPVADILRDRGIPFIFITAYDSSQISFLGPDDKVLRKPVNSNSLIDALRQVWPDLPPEIKPARLV